MASRNGRTCSSEGLPPIQSAPKPSASISATPSIPSWWRRQIPTCPSCTQDRLARVTHGPRVRIASASLALRIRLTLVLVALLAAAAPAAAQAALKARGSIEQAYVLGAKKGQRLQLLDAAAGVVGAGKADRFGSKIFRELRPGGGYRRQARAARPAGLQGPARRATTRRARSTSARSSSRASTT